MSHVSSPALYAPDENVGIGVPTPLFTINQSDPQLPIIILTNDDIKIFPVCATENESFVFGHKFELSSKAHFALLEMLKHKSFSIPPQVRTKATDDATQKAGFEINDKVRMALAALGLKSNITLVEGNKRKLTLSRDALFKMEQTWKDQPVAETPVKIKAVNFPVPRQEQAAEVAPPPDVAGRIIEEAKTSYSEISPLKNAVLASEKTETASVAQNTKNVPSDTTIESNIKLLSRLTTGFREYRQILQRTPKLDAGMTHDYAVRWKEKEDVKAMHLLVAAHMRMAIAFAVKYHSIIATSNARTMTDNSSIEELVSVGTIGLMTAIHSKRFDPHKASFGTYALFHVRGAVLMHLMRTNSMLAITPSKKQKKIYYNLGRMRAALRMDDEKNLSFQTATKIADILEVSFEAVMDMDQRLRMGELSLSEPAKQGENGREKGDGIADLTVDSPENIISDLNESNYAKDLLIQAMEGLSIRDRTIFLNSLREKPVEVKEAEMRKLSESDRALLCDKLKKTRVSTKILSSYYGVSEATVRDILKRTRKLVAARILTFQKTGAARALTRKTSVIAEQKEMRRPENKMNGEKPRRLLALT